MEEKFLDVFNEALELDNPVTLANSWDDIEGQWDSIGILTLISMVDDEFSVNLSSQDLKNTKTIQDIYDIVANRSA